MIIHGDSLEKLKDLEDNSVDLVCTDPPYGYSFMGKTWDKALPDIGIWRECLRVLKPGAFAFVMSAPRSDVQSRMALSLEEAGFEISFTPIYWTYASGFPKAMNIGKMVDKRAGYEREMLPTLPMQEATEVGSISKNRRCAVCLKAISSGNPCKCDRSTKAITDAAKALDGSYGGFQPKPAVEIVIVAMKPLSEKTYVDQALKNGKGCTWLDDCRVPTTITEKEELHSKASKNPTGIKSNFGGGIASEPHNAGRFPANLLVSDDVLNDGRIIKGNGAFPKKHGSSGFVSPEEREQRTTLSDSGSYSRYFDLDKWASTLPFLIVPKASKREKNEGLSHLPVKQTKGGCGMNDPHLGSAYGSIKAAGHNHHPTVKPLKLMAYLITLGSRPGDLILDPFCGSGTTCVAAKQLNRKFIGIEREEEYVKIAEARIEAVNNPLALF